MSDRKDRGISKESQTAITSRSSDSSGLPSTNLLDQALQQLTEEQKQDLMRRASEEALKIQAKQVEIAINEDAARRDTLDHIDTFNALDKNGKLSRHKLTTEVKTGVGTRRIESKSGATCFVVTACYNNPEARTVRFFRGYRDSVLVSRPAGRRFIVWYYRRGPRFAMVISRSRVARTAGKVLLTALAGVAWVHWCTVEKLQKN